MKVLRGNPAEWDSGAGHGVFAVGVFDGVHLGHRYVLSVLRDRAAETGLVAGVLTFEPHPLRIVAPDHAPAMLTGIDHRLELLAALGVEVTAVLEFDEKVREWTPARFLAETLAGPLAADLVVVGEDFRFGKDRIGDVALLGELGSQLGLTPEVVSLVGDDTPVSSTRIREMIIAGDVSGAAVSLARPHELWGEVVAGDGRGRTIGIPTANVAVPPEMAIPQLGVYAVTVGRHADEALPAVANVGVRPTFGGEVETIEAHVLDFDGDLYGQHLRMRFIDRIRGEQKFESAEALLTQIGRDIEQARQLLTPT
ncbi:MAG: bifunctional riboflavin kinase/FAD synthetase [Acidimicrobiia bacterium]